MAQSNLTHSDFGNDIEGNETAEASKHAKFFQGLREFNVDNFLEGLQVDTVEGGESSRPPDVNVACSNAEATKKGN